MSEVRGQRTEDRGRKTDDPAPNYGNGLFGAGQAEDGEQFLVLRFELWNLAVFVFLDAD